MKLNKFFLGLLGGVAIMAASCSNDDDYEWASVSGAQVYFSDALPTQYEISPDADVCNDVLISRADASNEMTVNITAEQEEGSIYTIPTSVTFAAGQTDAVLPITYDPTKIEYGKYETITLKIGDGTTPWGISEYTFKIGVTDWVPFGTALYREDLLTTFFSVDNVIYEVEIERNLLTEGLYRIVNPYGAAFPYNEEGDYDPNVNAYLTINATDPDYVYVEESPTAMNWGYGLFSMQSFVSFYMSGGNTLEVIKEKRPDLFGTLRDGIITMPIESMLISMADYNDGGWYKSNTNGLFAVALPGAAFSDYSSEVAYQGTFTNVNNEVFAVGYLTLGADAKVAKAVVAAGSQDPAAVAEAIAAGEIAAFDVQPGRIELPIDESLSGKLQIVAAVIVDGEVKSVASAKFEYYGGAASPWVSRGVGYYTDDFVVSFYTATEEEPDGMTYTYEVEIEENTETPGLYRIVNAYAPVAEAFGESGGDANIEIHAEDADGVYFLQQSTGLDFGDGEISIVSEGGRYVAANGYDVVKDVRPDLLGKLENGVITLPTFYIEDYDIYYQGLCILGTNGYYTGCNGAFKLVLPEAAAGVKAKAKAKAQATKFALRKKAANRKAVNSKCLKKIVANGRAEVVKL